MSKRDDDRKRWIDETKMFQRIAGRPEDTDEELGAEWDKLMTKRPRRTQKAFADNAETQRIILQRAAEAGKARRS